MTAPVAVDAPSVKSFAARANAQWIVVAGANPREKGIHDAAFGHYGATVAKVSFEHEYGHAPGLSADFAANYANRIVACADAMKGIEDPRAFIAAVAELIEAAKDAAEERIHDGFSSRASCDRLIAALARCGGAQ